MRLAIFNAPTYKKKGALARPLPVDGRGSSDRRENLLTQGEIRVGTSSAMIERLPSVRG